ncbi:MAG: response regulator [Gemmatimonadales bacterium]|jgi:signal transduction histidine kinase/DNA-binding response OmpR family regulator
MSREARTSISSAERLEVVAELASLINTTFDLDEIFRTAILKIGRVLEFRRASVVLVSDDRKSYYLHTLYDAAQGGFIEVEGTYPLDRGFTGQAIREGEALRIDTHSGTQGIRTAKEKSVSALIVPIHLDDQVIATLNFGTQESERYDDDDLELAVVLGRQIATSLHYSKLLATIDQQREELAEQHAHVLSERSRLEALIDASDAAILMVADGRVAYANNAMADLLALPLEVVRGAEMDRIDQTLSRSLTDPDAVLTQRQAMEGGEMPLRDRVEFHFPRKLVCQRTVAAVRRADGDVLGHLILYRDVTREAEAEAAKSEFVSLVSHELRTPLTSVKTSLSLLLRGAAGTLTDAAGDLLEIALRNLQRLIRLVDDLLDLSRVESGRVEIDLAAISLAESVRRAVSAVEGFAQGREVELVWDHSDEDALVIADSDRLQQVIVNLVSNAIKFSPQGSQVELRWWKQADQAVLEIADQGPGIPADQVERIFDKFRQLEQTVTRKYGGAGLGLAISRTIVDQMGGHIWAESEEGRGARFFVRLRGAHEKSPDEDVVAGESVRPLSVLLVERDADLQRLFETGFRDEGWDVSVESGGDAALERLEEEAVGVIAVGLSLQDMHGLEFLQRLRASARTVDVPALLVGPGGDTGQALSYGADGWVVGDVDGLIAEAKRLVQTPPRRVVLLIEDDPAVRAGLARGLRRAGYAVLEAASGEVGLELARARAPDLVVTDLQIPGKDGLGVLHELRDDPDLSGIPAIVVTGHFGSALLQEVESLRAHFLRKPFGMSTVLREVGRLIGAP